MGAPVAIAKDNRKAVVLALISIFFWSTASTAFKIALVDLNFVQLLLISTYVSSVVLFVILVAQRKLKYLFATKAKELAISAAVALLNPFGYYLILLKAYELLPAQIAQPLNYTWPLVLVILSAPILKQRIEPKSFAALIVSFVGVVIISSKGSLTSLLETDLTGVLLAAGSAIVWAHFWLFNVMDKRDEVVKLFLNFVFGSIYVTAVAWQTEVFDIPLGKGVLAAVYVGFFEMGLTFVLWLKAMQYATTTDRIGNLVYLSPFLALFFISIFLKEQILLTTYIGLLLIIISIFVQKVSWGRRKN